MVTYDGPLGVELYLGIAALLSVMVSVYRGYSCCDDYGMPAPVIGLLWPLCFGAVVVFALGALVTIPGEMLGKWLRKRRQS